MMTKEKYEKMAGVIRNHPQALGMLAAGNRILTALTYGAYILLLAAEAIGRDEKFCKVLLIPAAAFFLVTVFRKVCNAKRPYELLDIEPLLKRNKAGQSFPSSHGHRLCVDAGRDPVFDPGRFAGGDPGHWRRAFSAGCGGRSLHWDPCGDIGILHLVGDHSRERVSTSPRPGR